MRTSPELARRFLALVAASPGTYTLAYTKSSAKALKMPLSR